MVNRVVVDGQLSGIPLKTNIDVEESHCFGSLEGYQCERRKTLQSVDDCYSLTPKLLPGWRRL